MILESTIVRCIDNSGAKILKCIKVLGGSRKRVARLGDIIRVTIKVKKKKLNKKSIYRSIIVCTKFKTRRLDGTFIHVANNKVLLFSDQFKFLGTRVFGFLLKELRSNQILKDKCPKMIKYANIVL